MPQVPEGKAMLTIYVDKKVDKRVREIAKRRGVTMSVLVNDALWSMCATDLISCVLFGGARNADAFARIVDRLITVGGVGVEEMPELEKMRDVYNVLHGAAV